MRSKSCTTQSRATPPTRARRDASLTTEDIFSESHQTVRTEALIEGGGAADSGGHLPALQAVIDAVDTSGEVPRGAPPHAAAAALLAYFKALPMPFFPESVSTVRDASARSSVLAAIALCVLATIALCVLCCVCGVG
jgi:hypothetical protein